MDKTPSEVLIYIQNLKNYFKSNEEVKKYFIVNEMEEEFYSEAIIISEHNFKKTGEPMLSVEQFESIRFSMLNQYMGINKTTNKVFVDYNEFGKFYLN